LVVTGVDIGSRTIKIIVMDSGRNRIKDSRKVETTFNPMRQCKRLLADLRWDRLVATGYGRRLVQESFQADVITEIQAHAMGARRLFSDCLSVLDIGGQDTKAISLDDRGRIKKFEMNDRCAAGTGKFLEFMSVSFQVPIEEFGDFALRGKPGLSINSMCTVFAETEATSLMARGNDPRDIARALHLSVVKRSLSMLNRVSTNGPLVFSGGVAKNRCVVELVKEQTGSNLLIPDEPDMVGALGAALYGVQN
jgi:(R)-2-hydroxyacyl-CoA dehydratese activating ATPase